MTDKIYNLVKSNIIIWLFFVYTYGIVYFIYLTLKLIIGVPLILFVYLLEVMSFILSKIIQNIIFKSQVSYYKMLCTFFHPIKRFQKINKF